MWFGGRDYTGRFFQIGCFVAALEFFQNVLNIEIYFVYIRVLLKLCPQPGKYFFVFPHGNFDLLKETFLVGFAFEQTAPQRTVGFLLTDKQTRISEHAGL